MKITLSKEDAKWYRAWKKRIDAGTPKEGDFNFAVFNVDGEKIYEPPAENADPAVYRDGEWKSVKELAEELGLNQPES